MSEKQQSSSRVKSVLAVIIVVALGVGATAIIFSSEPTAKRTRSSKKTAMLVDVEPVDFGTFQPKIIAVGTVQAERDIQLSARVAGQIKRVSDDFSPGRIVAQDTVLAQIDPADFRNTLAQRKSELAQAKTALAVEMGRQNIARKDFETLTQKPNAAREALILREPQLAAAKAQVAAAKAQVNQAWLELKRTKIRAPFAAQVLARNADIGTQVAVGTPIGRLVATERYWVVATVPQSTLRWLSFSDDDSPSQAVLSNRSAWGDKQTRTGTVDRFVGALLDKSRMARIIVTVDDPLAQQASGPPLTIGEFLEVSITGATIPDVFRIRNDYLRKNDSVWVMADGKLLIRNVKIALRDATYAYISDGLKPGEKIITTNLAAPRQGAALRLRGAPQETGE